jgi:L-threonylcarbamoyladenylate synthase
MDQTEASDLIGRAAASLRAGALVAFPTETVYGLGADAANGRAVAAIYEAKGRPSFNPLIAHVAELSDAVALGRFDGRAEALAAAFWPGALTLVVPAMENCPVHDLARAGLPTVAIRIPAHPVALALLAEFGGPVVAPSANRSGHVSPTRAEHVIEDLGDRVAQVLDAGPTSIGLESTVLLCLPREPVRLLRPGGVSRTEIEAIIGETLGDRPDEVLAPGMTAQHYAPTARVRLNADDADAGEAWLGFGPAAGLGGHGVAHLNLSPAGNLAEAATNLFAYLRELDALRPSAIAVAPIPATGLGEAINDRLARAAHQ